MDDNDTQMFEFQICDWNSYHEMDDEIYVIQLFGRTEDDQDVCLKVVGFTPFFYVEIPEFWTNKEVKLFVDVLKDRVSRCMCNSGSKNLTSSQVRYTILQKHKFYNFTNKKLFKFVLLAFRSQIVMKKFVSILSKPLKIPGVDRISRSYQIFESNIEPHIRFMHINNLSSCGWVSIEKSKLKKIDGYSFCDHSYEVYWRNVKPSKEDNRMAPFKIMGYDIECVSCDENFPQAGRKDDKIIQIGLTMYRYGSMECYEQHILTLKKCAPIKNVCLECYETEKELIRGFAQKIRKLRPDFMVGYNNFGFDDKYIYDRIMRIDQEEADELGVDVNSLENKFIDEILTTMGKVNNRYIIDNEGVEKSLTQFETKFLSSSALGDNELKFFHIPGILSIDMMKVIQRNHSLSGYKLDNVSANFINERVEEITEIEKEKLSSDNYDKIGINIYTRSTKALEKKSYIQIVVDDGYSRSPLNDGSKYKVLDIVPCYGNNGLIERWAIKIEINSTDLKELKDALSKFSNKVLWTFAKNDMHHTSINKIFADGDPKGIRKIAVYCLKDCKLVNLLLAKLEIIVNSIGMAKVCHVPLSYLFLRGQGVKIFSLVSKKCREKNFLIPVLQRKEKDDSITDEETYEGATVISPKPAVYLSPIGVLDYSSLYPNSMREKNLSHECYVNDPKYDNLPGYIYHDVEIVLKDKKGMLQRNLDGTIKKERHRFAQEIVTDEQINEELREVFDKIRSDMNENIKKITEQRYLSDDNRKIIINNEKVFLEREMQEQIAKVRSQAERINDIRKITEKRINEVECQKDLENDKRRKIVEKMRKEMNEEIEKINEEVEMTEEFRKILIDNERENAQKKMNDEKLKKYNFSQGKFVRYGILPEILTELLNKRKETNNKLSQEKDPFVKSILNALQLAYKITANSLYGQTGAPTSPIYFVAIAACTTAIGRERLQYAKEMVEKNFSGSEVIYGDSVTEDTPLILRDENKDIQITTIGELGNNWEPYISGVSCKEQAKTKYLVWTSKGWAKIRRIIRHKTTKKLYRIMTGAGCVDVTEDHSLLGKNGEMIKPGDCLLGMELMHGFVEPTNRYSNISVDEAFVWGCFMRNGNCSIWKRNEEYQYSWELTSWNLELLKRCKTILEKLEGIKFNILDQMIVPFKLVPVERTKYLTKKYRHFLYDGGNKKIVPMEVLNAILPIKNAYIEGYLSAQGNNGYSIKVAGKVVAQSFYYLLRCLGYSVTIDLQEEEYTLEYLSNNTKDLFMVRKKQLLEVTSVGGYGSYLYDLETDAGSFMAGVGEIIVKNTDSIFINFHIKDANGNDRTDKDALVKTIELAQKAAKIINDNVPRPQTIVYEKTLHPFILVAKKKYVGLLYEKDPNRYSLKSMGVVLKRRDNAPIVKIVVGGIINHILKNRDIKKAIEYTEQVIQNLMDGKYPIDKFIISKTLKAKYKKPSTIAHKILADRMALRDPGNKPQINDRIPFVYIVKDFGTWKKKDILQGDLVEHPDYVIKNNLKVDYLYYLKHQIINPATQILELMIPTKDVEKFFNRFIIEEESKRRGRQSMVKWMKCDDLVLDQRRNIDTYHTLLSTDNQNKKPTKRPESQNMDKWLQNGTWNSDDWQPVVSI
ncbi:MAG: DNA polymerase domain-containing protein [Thermoplasmata archaeon]